VLKKVGTAVRAQLAQGAFIELQVVVDDGWQNRADRIERLGY
jgi:GTPase Era involved in 16S rRNA processing